MRALIADVGDGGADRRGDLPLHGSVPGVDGWEAVIERANEGIDPIWQEWSAVDPDALGLIRCECPGDWIDTAWICDGVAVARRQGAAKSRCRIQKDRPARQEEGGVEVLPGCQS